MRLSRALEDKKLDLRLRDKLMHEGKLSKADIDQYLATLPDDSANAATTSSLGGEERAQTTGSSES